MTLSRRKFSAEFKVAGGEAGRGAQDDGLCRLAESIAKALNSEIRRGVRQACADFLSKYGWVLRSAEASDSRSRLAPSSGPRERLGY